MAGSRGLRPIRSPPTRARRTPPARCRSPARRRSAPPPRRPAPPARRTVAAGPRRPGGSPRPRRRRKPRTERPSGWRSSARSRQASGRGTARTRSPRRARAASVRAPRPPRSRRGRRPLGQVPALVHAERRDPLHRLRREFERAPVEVEVVPLGRGAVCRRASRTSGRCDGHTLLHALVGRDAVVAEGAAHQHGQRQQQDGRGDVPRGVGPPPVERPRTLHASGLEQLQDGVGHCAALEDRRRRGRSAAWRRRSPRRPRRARSRPARARSASARRSRRPGRAAPRTRRAAAPAAAWRRPGERPGAGAAAAAASATSRTRERAARGLEVVDEVASRDDRRRAAASRAAGAPGRRWPCR